MLVCLDIPLKTIHSWLQWAEVSWGEFVCVCRREFNRQRSWMEHSLQMRQQLAPSDFGNGLFLNISGPRYNMISYEYLSLWVDTHRIESLGFS